ncbi:reverse transcriptase domain-containing protein [Tanacetum coccineum]
MFLTTHPSVGADINFFAQMPFQDCRFKHLFGRRSYSFPILIALNWDQPFEIMCDASDYAIGAVLGQRIEKHFRPIHYASKTMTEAETNYTTTEKEMLVVVYAFEKFRSYLIMNKPVDAAGSGATTSAIRAITSGAG